MDGELIRGLSIGLADIGECDRGEVVLPTKLSLCIATAALRDGNCTDFFDGPCSF